MNNIKRFLKPQAALTQVSVVLSPDARECHVLLPIGSTRISMSPTIDTRLYFYTGLYNLDMVNLPRGCWWLKRCVDMGHCIMVILRNDPAERVL